MRSEAESSIAWRACTPGAGHGSAKRALACLGFLVLLLVLPPGCRSGAFPEYASDYREYAYVANGGSNTVSVLDLVNVRPQTLVVVDAHPVALAANPRRNEVYVASQGRPSGNGSLTVIDAVTNRAAATLPLGRNPRALALNSMGTRLYAANAGTNSVSVLAVTERRVLGVVGVGEGPEALAVSPDNTTLVVANRASGSVSLLELVPDRLPRLRASFAGCPGAGSIAILPDSTKTFVACSDGHQVMAIGLRTAPAARLRGRNAPEADRLLALLDVGAKPVRLVMKPDGGEIFAANQASDTVSEIATGTDEVGGASLIGAHPASGVVSADNALLWVSNENADTVAVYSIDDGKLVNTVHVGSGPGPLTFSADGHLLLAADTRSGDIALLRTFSRNLHREAVYGSMFTLLPAGGSPDAIVDKAFRLTH